MATNFIVGRCTASAIAFASRKVILLSLGIGSHVLRRHQTSIVTKHPELTTEINSEKENGPNSVAGNQSLAGPVIFLVRVTEKEAILNSPPPKQGPSGGQFVLLAVLVAILIVTVVWATTVWTSSNDVPMSKHGWIALGLGTLFSLVIGCGLMALMFFSSRSGHDEVATPKFTKRPEDTTQDD